MYIYLFSWLYAVLCFLPCIKAYRSALRLAIDSGEQERVVDAFLDRHSDVKPGLQGDPEIDWRDEVSTSMI